MSPKSKRELMKEQKTKEENIQKLEEHIRKQRKLPKEYQKKITKQVILNAVTMLVMLVFLGCLNVMSLNIETVTYLNILRILSIVVGCISIVYFELGYRKDNEKVFFYGIEIFVLALITLSSIYLYYMFFTTYSQILIYISLAIAVYYFVKILIIQRNMRKQYYKDQNDIKEIVKKG